MRLTGLVAGFDSIVAIQHGTEARGPVAGSAIERRRVELEDAVISCQVAGKGPPLVLIHGLGGSTRWWVKNIGPLSRQFCVYVVDLVGFGESRGRHRFVLTEAAGYLARWLDRLDVARVNVVGHSMGGFVAAELAADFPDRVERLVLVDAAALPFDYGYFQHAVGMTRGLRHLSLQLLPVLAQDALRAGPASIWNATRQLLTSDLRPKLARIEAPTLVVWGEDDTIVPLTIGQELVRQIPRTRLVIVPRAGHHPNWEEPDAFNRAVVEFLTDENEVDSRPEHQPPEP